MVSFVELGKASKRRHNMTTESSMDDLNSTFGGTTDTSGLEFDDTGHDISTEEAVGPMRRRARGSNIATTGASTTPTTSSTAEEVATTSTSSLTSSISESRASIEEPTETKPMAELPPTVSPGDTDTSASELDISREEAAGPLRRKSKHVRNTEDSTPGTKQQAAVVAMSESVSEYDMGDSESPAKRGNRYTTGDSTAMGTDGVSNTTSARPSSSYSETMTMPSTSASQGEVLMTGTATDETNSEPTGSEYLVANAFADAPQQLSSAREADTSSTVTDSVTSTTEEMPIETTHMRKDHVRATGLVYRSLSITFLYIETNCRKRHAFKPCFVESRSENIIKKNCCQNLKP